MNTWLTDFFSLFFPKVCAACGDKLGKQERVVCTRCLSEIPKTRYHEDADNPVAKLFWGRVSIHHATALFRFHKGSRFQELLHQLKYKGRQDVGEELGRQLGFELLKSDLFITVDYIIPVPLHPKRQHKRGYNQAECIARGISESTGFPLMAGNLIRNTATETQTRKSRIERWQNVNSIFTITNQHILENSHVLLVDDVVTTGATIEACAAELAQTPGIKISIATLAVA